MKLLSELDFEAKKYGFFSYWQLIETHLPNYDHRDDVYFNNALCSYFTGECSLHEIGVNIETDEEARLQFVKSSNKLFSEALDVLRSKLYNNTKINDEQ